MLRMAIVLLALCVSDHPARNVGKDWGSEQKSYLDPLTGVRILELTGNGSAADNLYFHFSSVLPRHDYGP